MADKLDRGAYINLPREKPEHQLEDRFLSRTSNYNETVRANNRRYDRGEAGKRLPKGRTAARQYKASGR